MAYAGSTTRSRGGTRPNGRSAPAPRSGDGMARRPAGEMPVAARPVGTPSTGRDWSATGRAAGLFGTGLALGLLVGAGIALLSAPHTGAEMRALLGAQAHRVRRRADNAWDELGDELRWAARRGGRSVRHGITRGRWAAADLIGG